MPRWKYWLGIGAFSLAQANPSSAQQFELAVDPFPYLADGYSLHVAHRILGGKHRAQVGVFAADVPEALHSNDGFDVRVRAMSVKLDHFFKGGAEGVFVGFDSVFGHLEYTYGEAGMSDTRNQVWVGPRVGYRRHFGDKWYVTPWVSAYYRTNASDFEVAGQSFEEDRVIVLPTIHIGYRFD